MQLRFTSVSGEVQCSTSPYVPTRSALRTEVLIYGAAVLSFCRTIRDIEAFDAVPGLQLAVGR